MLWWHLSQRGSPCLINHIRHASLLGPFHKRKPSLYQDSLSAKNNFAWAVQCTHRERTQKGKFSNRLAHNLLAAEFIDSDWGDKSQLRQWVDNLMPELSWLYPPVMDLWIPLQGPLHKPSPTTPYKTSFLRPRLKTIMLGLSASNGKSRYSLHLFFHKLVYHQ
jgi:hypothetical protein